MRQLNTMDSLFVFMDQRGSGMHSAMMQVFAANTPSDPGKRYRRIVARIMKAVPRIPLLHEKIHRVPVDADRPYWVRQDGVDIDYHFRHVAVPPPGNWEQLEELYGQICSIPMDLELPLWQVYVVEGLSGIKGLPAGSFAVITKLHHAGADGITAARVTAVIAGAPIAEAARGVEVSDDSEVPGIYDLMSKSVANQLGSSLRLGRETVASLPAMWKWAAKSVVGTVTAREKTDKEGVPDTRFNKYVSPDRVFGSVSFKRRDIQAIRSRIEGVTTNDVALAVCGGALRAYLKLHNELPEESLVAIMPVSVRSDEVGGNQFSVARVNLHTAQKSASKRLRLIHEQTATSKQKIKSFGGRRLQAISNVVPAPLLAAVMRNAVRYGLAARMPALANVMVSNVSGPRERLSFDGNELVFMHGSPPIMNGLGLIIGVMSYHDELTLAVTTCKAMVPDKAVMLGCIRDAFAELKLAMRGAV